MYCRLASETVKDRCGGLHSACCLPYSVDFATIERMQVQGRWDDAASALSEAGRARQAGGADPIVLCTNTVPKLADTLAAAVAVPLLHIGDTTAAAVLRAGIGVVREQSRDATGGSSVGWSTRAPRA